MSTFVVSDKFARLERKIKYAGEAAPHRGGDVSVAAYQMAGAEFCTRTSGIAETPQIFNEVFMS